MRQEIAGGIKKTIRWGFSEDESVKEEGDFKRNGNGEK